jgi:hypothetical protein
MALGWPVLVVQNTIAVPLLHLKKLSDILVEMKLLTSGNDFSH